MLFRLGGETKRGVGFCRRRHCHPHFQREGAAAGCCTCHPRTTRCASSAAHPEQTNPRKTPSKAQHTLHQRPARIGNERACVLCFVFGDVNPKSVQKGAALAPMHSVTLCVRVCSCGWCPNTVKLLFVCGWWPNAQAIACAWCAKGQRAAFCLSVPAAAAARLQQPAAQRHNHHHNPASPTSCCVAPPAGRRCQPSLAAESNQSQPVSTWPSCCVLSL